MEPEGDGVTAAVTAAGLGVSGCLKLGQELKIGFEFRTVAGPSKFRLNSPFKLDTVGKFDKLNSLSHAHIYLGQSTKAFVFSKKKALKPLLSCYNLRVR